MRQTVDTLRASWKALTDMLSPYASLSAIYMRSSMLSYLGLVGFGFGFGMVASVRSAQGASLQPVLCVPSLRQTLPVPSETPMEREASV